MDNNEKYNEKYINNRLSITKALKNAHTLDSNENGNDIKLSDTQVDINNAETIFIRSEDGKVIPIILIPSVLKNGEKILTVIDEEGQDMACIFLDHDEEFKLTPRMEKEILVKAINGKIKGSHVNDEIIRKALFPESLEDFEKEIEENNLIPKDVEETIKKIKEVDPNTNIEEAIEKENELEEDKEDKSELEEEAILPDEVRDEVARIKNTEGARLKHVLLTKNPSSISDKLVDDAGIRENGEPVYCLSFQKRSLEIDSDRIVFVQGTRVIDDRKYDDDATEVLEQYRNSSVVQNIEDDENKVIYTDLDGHTIVADMETEPRDLSIRQKELLAEELEKLDNEEDAIRSSDMPLEDKIEANQKINEKRIALFDKYGLKIPEIRSEMRGDDEIGEEIQNDIEERNDEDDEYDPRETRHIREERE